MSKRETPKQLGNVEGVSQGGNQPSPARSSTGHHAGPQPYTNKENSQGDCGGVGVSVEGAVLAKDPIFEQTAILGTLPPLQDLWIFHEVMAWASHSLGPPCCWLLRWWNKATFTGSGGSVY